MNEQDLIKLHQAYFIFGDRTVLKILKALLEKNELTFTQLKHEVHVNPASLTKKLKLLTKFGILRAEKNRDNLRVFYSINISHRQIKRMLDSIENLSQEF